jgi:cysteine desulfurase / selenocysteine lyase
VRKDFPLLHDAGIGKPLVYLDSAATSLRPRAVVDALAHAHGHELASAHRGVHALSRRATDAYEAARECAARFIHAPPSEVVFVRGTTEALNLVAECWARPRLRPGDELLVTELEHHSNWLPWQRVARSTGTALVIAPVDDRGQLDLAQFEQRLGPRTRLVACAHVGNVLGDALPLRHLCELVRARSPDAVVVVDGAQAAPHLEIDVAAIGCDFYAFSGHKLYGPSGSGVLWGRAECLQEMPPYQLGGGMVAGVSLDDARFLEPPHRFEAGTPDVASAIGLAAAIDYLGAHDRAALRRHEAALIAYATDRLRQLPGVRLLGAPGVTLEADASADGESASLLSFVMDGVHAHDIGTILDGEGVAIRTGHHCAQPLVRRLGVPATARVSVGMYNTQADIDALVHGLRRTLEWFS